MTCQIANPICCERCFFRSYTGVQNLIGVVDFAQKKIFANDPLNHVASVPYVNQTLKSAYVPLKFITKLRNSRYDFANGKCEEYVELYVQVKKKYGLNFSHNKIDLAKAACR